ncbi:MAG: hypothetical protein ABW172_09555 [Candidatus Binatia bacterium]
MLALNTLKSFNLRRTLFVPLLVSVLAASGVALGQTTATKNATIEEIRAFFKGKQKTVLTFVGYSGAGYQDEAGMRQQAEGILGDYDPAKTIINIGATPDGIGAIYEIAKHKGFVTTGIVSSQAKRYNAKLSPYVDHAFYVEDETWGGFVKETKDLSPTSKAIVESSDILIGIGGGEVARDELVAAKRLGKKVRFYPADMNHRKARESAKKKKLPEPTDFRGAAGAAF